MLLVTVGVHMFACNAAKQLGYNVTCGLDAFKLPSDRPHSATDGTLKVYCQGVGYSLRSHVLAS